MILAGKEFLDEARVRPSHDACLVVVRRQRLAALGKQLRKDLIMQDVAVEQRAVEIEKECAAVHAGIPRSGEGAIVARWNRRAPRQETGSIMSPE